MSGLNNKFLGTKSRVLTIPSIVCSYITGLIDGTVNLEGLEYEEEFYDISQKLKRLLYYTSSNKDFFIILHLILLQKKLKT